MSGDNKNGCAIVTGGSRGIGAAIAERLARDGCDVVLTYRSNAEQAETVAASCRSLGVRAFAVQAELSSEDDCLNLVEAARDRLGPIRVLVNNAGLTRDGLVLRMSREQFSSVIDVNLIGPFMPAAVLTDMVRPAGEDYQHFLDCRHLRQRRQANYAAAKSGLIGERTLAKKSAVGALPLMRLRRALLRPT